MSTRLAGPWGDQGAALKSAGQNSNQPSCTFYACIHLFALKNFIVPRFRGDKVTPLCCLGLQTADITFIGSCRDPL